VGKPFSPAWLAAAIVASAVLVAVAPLVGQLSALLRDVTGGHYAAALKAIVVSLGALAVIIAVVSIRERRLQRFSWLAAAVLLGVSYALLTRTGVPDVDAAERFHLVEYGFVAVLFYKAWRPSSDGAPIVITLIAGFLVGTLEEWLQWFVPGRVGEAKDVLLNLISVVAGVLFSIGLDPPPRLTLALTSTSRRPLALVTTLAVLAFAAFFQSVHMGHEIADREAGVFKSRYSASELAEVSAARAERWQTDPPLTWSRYSREDQFLTEGIAHVRRRNERWDAGNTQAARQENLILEKYYGPVLDTPSYISASSLRWPVAQRAQAEQHHGPGFMIYVSDALTYPVVTWPVPLYWLVVVSAILLTLRRIL
jgi:hypothetical protein